MIGFFIVALVLVSGYQYPKLLDTTTTNDNIENIEFYSTNHHKLHWSCMPVSSSSSSSSSSSLVSLTNSQSQSQSQSTSSCKYDSNSLIYQKQQYQKQMQQVS